MLSIEDTFVQIIPSMVIQNLKTNRSICMKLIHAPSSTLSKMTEAKICP